MAVVDCVKVGQVFPSTQGESELADLFRGSSLVFFQVVRIVIQ